MKMKRLTVYTLVFTLLVSIVALGAVYADPSSELTDVNSKLEDVKQKKNEAKKQEKELLQEMKDLEGQIAQVETEIQKMQGDINETRGRITQAQKDLDEAQAQVDQQNDDMNARLRAMYKNGNVGTLEILLGSENITDFLNNMDMVQRIMDNDVEILKRLEEQHELLEQHKKQLQALQNQLEKQQDDEKAKQAALVHDKNEVAVLKNEVAANLKELEAMEDSLVAAANALTNQIRALSSSSATSSYGGYMSWPTSGSITSHYGNRIHPILGTKKLHTGMDIAVPTGTPIKAADAGTVIIATFNSSYGNYVVVDHGGGVTTLYGHNSSLAVSVNTSVEKGQVIAYAGSTGMSTGPHCHFEVRVDGQYKDPRNYLQ